MVTTTKQEALRVGIEVMCHNMMWGGLQGDSRERADKLLQFLHDNDVVIKVMEPWLNRSLTREEQRYLASGGKMFEPLI